MAEVTFEEWERTVPAAMRADALWRVTAYRLALFVPDLAWRDVTVLARDRRTFRLSGQLYEAVCSIGANIAEGYSRSGARDRCRFYEYALGSACEARDWYFKVREILGPEVVAHRIDLLTRVIQLLLTMIPQQRAEAVREPAPVYEVRAFSDDREQALIEGLLADAPLPSLPDDD